MKTSTYRIQFDAASPITGTAYFKVQKWVYFFWWTIADTLRAEEAKRIITTIKEVYNWEPK